MTILIDFEFVCEPDPDGYMIISFEHFEQLLPSSDIEEDSEPMIQLDISLGDSYSHFGVVELCNECPLCGWEVE